MICPPSETPSDPGGPSTSAPTTTAAPELGVKSGKVGKNGKLSAKTRFCEHGRRSNGYYCRECGGKGICEHDRQRSKCRDCGGKSVCKHNRIRYQCTECGGASICPHGRMGYQCKECGGSSICHHKRVRAYCKECKGSQICAHNRVKSHCAACKGSQICEHGVQRSFCEHCGGRLQPPAPAEGEQGTAFSILKHFDGKDK